MVDGTYNVLEAAARKGVRRVVAASSALVSVYGLAETFPTKESHHPYANSTLYGAAKMFNEELLRSLHAMSGRDLRYFNVYGPGWISTASTPRAWCAGWSGSRRGHHR